MASPQTCFVSLVLLLSISAHSASASTTTDFIRTSCNETLYSSLCLATLSPYASSVNNNKNLLVETAISVSLKKSKAAATHIQRIAASATDSKLSSVIIQDCVSNLKDAADLARDSLKQMKEISTKGSIESAKFEVANIQTWMSAALSNQVTCIDELKGVADVSGTIRKVEVAKMTTSNVLALVNKFMHA